MVSEVDTSRITSALSKSAELLPLSVCVHLRSDPTGLVTVFSGHRASIEIVRYTSHFRGSSSHVSVTSENSQSESLSARKDSPRKFESMKGLWSAEHPSVISSLRLHP